MTPAFRDWVDEAKAKRIADVLAERGIQLKGKGSNRAGPCPQCGGDDRFGVDIKRDLFNCRGCGAHGQGAIKCVQWLDGCNFLKACETLTGRPAPKDDEPKQKTPSSKKTRGRFVCAYPYADEIEVEQFQVCRYAEPKSFSQRRPDPVHEGAWIENLDGVRMVPYRLPDLMEQIANGRRIYFFEGEKDVDTAVSMGLTATTTAMGVAGKVHWERGLYDEFFRGADVVVVPDQDLNDPKGRKGRKLAQAVTKRLHGVADRVRMLTLPAKDFTEWVEAGGTREQFDAMPLIDYVEPNGNGHHPEGMAELAGLWQGQDAKAEQPVEPTTYVLPDPATIPKRVWMFAMHYMRKVVTGTVAPGGFGKTTLALFEALSMVALGFRVWYISGEDDRDEIDRRIAAHHARHAPGPLDGRLFVDDKLSFPFKIAKSSRAGPDFDDAKLAAFEAAIKQRAIDVVILDPFVSFHFLNESDTASMDALVKRLGEICVRCDCCIELSHHVRKPGLGQVEVTVYDARGAAAIVNAVRSCRVINQMTAVEAQQVRAADKPASYIRIDSGKRNMAPPEKARWMHLVSMQIANGDHVQAIEYFDFKPEQITRADDDWLIMTMTSGKQYRADSRSPDWLGHEVARHFNRSSDKKGDVIWINNQIRVWMSPASHRKQPLLRKVSREDKDRKERVFFELVEAEVINLDERRGHPPAGEDE